MPSEEVRKRLEALNGGPLRHEEVRPARMANVPEPCAAPEAEMKGRAPRAASTRRRQARMVGEANARLAGSRGAPADLSGCLPGTVCAAPGGGACYVLRRPVEEAAPWACALAGRVCAALDGDPLRAHLRRITGVKPGQALFLDLETLGLRAEPLFLVGALRVTEDGGAECCQFLARDGGEEGAAIAAFGEMLREARLLVTFNGRTFDVPFLKRRAEALGVGLPRIPTHLDVLVEARKRYRRLWRDCRLQTLEQRLCGRTRAGDIPGAEIPRVYRRFLRTGDASGLAVIVQHNLLDLATTAELLAHLWG